MRYFVLLSLISLIIVGCVGTGQSIAPTRGYDPQAVIGKTWQWQSTITAVEKIKVAQPESYTLRLNENGRAELRFDCNRGGGAYQISEGKLSFGPMMSTRMACPEGSLDATYMQQLQGVNQFFVEGDSLYLELPAESGIMQFN